MKRRVHYSCISASEDINNNKVIYIYTKFIETGYKIYRNKINKKSK